VYVIEATTPSSHVQQEGALRRYEVPAHLLRRGVHRRAKFWSSWNSLHAAKAEDGFGDVRTSGGRDHRFLRNHATVFLVDSGNKRMTKFGVSARTLAATLRRRAAEQRRRERATRTSATRFTVSCTSSTRRRRFAGRFFFSTDEPRRPACPASSWSYRRPLLKKEAGP